jgi:hypothetical protein
VKKHVSKISIVFILAVTTVFGGCIAVSGTNVPKGYVSSKEYFDKEGFQDYTDYCVYYYENAEAVISDKNFKLITASENGKTGFMEQVKDAASEVIGWMKTLGRENELEITADDITAGDYAYLYRTQNSLVKLYLFDSETNTLHYMASKT